MRNLGAHPRRPAPAAPESQPSIVGGPAVAVSECPIACLCLDRLEFAYATRAAEDGAASSADLVFGSSIASNAQRIVARPRNPPMISGDAGSVVRKWILVRIAKAISLPNTKCGI